MSPHGTNLRYSTDIALLVESTRETRVERAMRNKWGVQPNTFQRGTTGFQTLTGQYKPQLTSCRFNVCCLYASQPQWQMSIWICVMLLCLPAHPLPAEHTHSVMHKHFNTVLRQLLHTEALCLTSLAVIMTGPFSTNWHAHSLVTCHTPGCSKPDGAITLHHTDPVGRGADWFLSVEMCCTLWPLTVPNSLMQCLYFG